MRVLQIGKFHFEDVRGGVERVVYDLCRGMRGSEVRSDILCAGVSKRFTVSRAGGYVVYKAACYGKKFSTAIAPQMIPILRRIQRNYDIIHLHHPDPLSTLALFLSGYNGVVITHWHSDIVRQKLLLKFFMPLQKWLIKRSHTIVCTSKNYAEASEHLRYCPSKIKIIPIGIEPKEQLSEDQVRGLKLKYGDRKIIFALGRLVSYKGFEYLIESARCLPPDKLILIAGEGVLEGALSRMILAMNLQDKVKMLGALTNDEVVRHLNFCHVFCLPSVEKNEAFGVVLLEAMSLGKPLITSRVEGSGIHWVNREGVSGFHVPVRDPLAMAQAIEGLFADPVRYEKLSEGSKERFEEIFTLPKMVDGVLRLYKEALINL